MACKVLMVSPCESGGHPTYVREVLMAVHRCGSECEVAVELLASTALDKPFRCAPYPVQCVLPSYPDRSAMGNAQYRWNQFLYPVRVDTKVIAWLEKHPEIDGVHFQDYFNLGSAFKIGAYRKTGKWLAFTVHNIRSHRYLPMGRTAMDAMARIAWRNCDALFVHSEELKRQLSKFLGLGHPRIHVTPHGVFGTGNPVGVQDLGARLRQKRLLFFGAVRANKGLHVALEALRELDGFSLTIAGGGPVESTYWNQAASPLIDELRAKGKNIEVISSYIPEESLHTLWDRHSAVLLPYSDGFRAQSGVLFLAIGLQTPAITSGAGAMAETLRAHPVGEAMRSNDARGLIAAIHALYARDLDELQRTLSDAREALSWDRSAHSLIEAYIEMNRRHAARSVSQVSAMNRESETYR